MTRRSLLALFILTSSAFASAAIPVSAPNVAPTSSISQCFPASIAGFETATFPADQAASLKAHRNTEFAGYNSRQYGLAITVYVYDRLPGGDEAQELRDVTSAVLASHPGSEIAARGRGSIPLSGKATEAVGGLFLWSEGTTDYGSFLWLVTRGNHHLKIRATYIRPIDAGVEAMQYTTASISTVAKSICTPD